MVDQVILLPSAHKSKWLKVTKSRSWRENWLRKHLLSLSCSRAK